MPEPHDKQLKECAVRFAELHGELHHLRNGKVEQATATTKLTNAVEALGKLVVSYHTEVVTELAATKESTKSAHHRLNWLFGIVAAIGGGGALAVLATVLTK